MQKIYYFGYYGDPSPLSKREATPAADTKMSYIIESMRKTGYDVEVISLCIEENRNVFFERKPGYEIIRNDTKVVFFDSYTSKYRILRVIGRWLSWMKIRGFLQKYCLNDSCKIVIYHSLGLFSVINFFYKKKKAFVLEMEEIYADVIGEKRVRKKEIAVAHKASGYIFPTELLDQAINISHKLSVTIHGTYHVEHERKVQFDDGKIHVVYAGTFDPQKGGGAAAAAAAEFLPPNYHIHILGFGSKTDIADMKDMVLKLNKKCACSISYDGCLSGEEYIRFIQSCDIGLSTQNPEAAFNNTSFPSKVLSYMTNGLRVVSVRIEAVERSCVGDMVTYYDEQTPAQIAEAIMSVDMSIQYDSKVRILMLDEQFQRNIHEMLEQMPG